MSWGFGVKNGVGNDRLHRSAIMTKNSIYGLKWGEIKRLL